MLRREDYKAIKRMDREQMSAYFQKIYQRGFSAGLKASVEKAKPADNVEAKNA